MEHVHGSLGNSNSVICYDTFWRSLPVGVIKINVDVTILTYSTTTVAVVRNDLGQVIKAWAKKSIPPSLVRLPLDGLWSIYTLRSDTLALVLVSEFVSCNFYWVKWETNMAAQSLAKPLCFLFP